AMKKQKAKFMLSHKVKSVERKGDEIIVKADDKNGKEVEFKGDYCLVSVGRRPFTDGLNADKAGVEINDKGKVVVNK
ncbi:FAD-dependent oxidoreductase, partial [Aquimarina celericrescens]|nr:FAD-dependent oxidoreductase [Aquimarina celericrescens]